MFALCHFKDDELKFVLYDKKDIKEVTEQMNIEVEETFDFEKFEKDYSLYPMQSLDDLLIHTLTHKARTATHKLDELDISCWLKLKQEYNKIQEKKSNLSRSQRDLVEAQYSLIMSM